MDKHHKVSSNMDDGGHEDLHKKSLSQLLERISHPPIMGEEDKETKLRQAIARNPSDSRLHYELARYLAQNRRYEEAKIASLTARELDPSDFRPYNALGLIALNEHDYEQAEQYLLEACRLEPDDFRLYSNLGLVYLKQQRYKEAEHAFSVAIKKNPDSASPHTNLGLVYAKLKKYESAKKEWIKAKELSMDDPIVYTNLCYANLLLGNYEEAERYCKLAVELAPSHCSTHENLGTLYYKLSHLVEAKESFMHALLLDNGLWSARTYLSNIYLIQADESGDRDLFSSAYKNYSNVIKFVESQPEDIDTIQLANLYHARGYTLVKLGSINDALDDFKKALHINKIHPTAEINMHHINSNNIELISRGPLPEIDHISC